ncbi:MAG: ECF-type sigma factor [Planctomycetota bacterium]
MRPAPITSLLNQSLAGDPQAAGLAWTEVYGEVRAIAAAALARDSAAAADMQPTVLVHEVFLRIGRSPPLAWDSRRHFFGAVRHACEQHLVDEARARNALKRGGGAAAVPLTFVARELRQPEGQPDAGGFDLQHALELLAQRHPRAAEAARLRFTVGASVASIASTLGVSTASIEKDLQFAKAWLRRELDRGP